MRKKIVRTPGMVCLPLTILRPTTSNEIRSLIMTSNNSSCILDSMPTKLLKQCVDEVLPMITAIVNNSLTHRHFSSDIKHAIIKPHVKKPGLDINESLTESLTTSIKPSISIEDHLKNSSK